MNREKVAFTGSRQCFSQTFLAVFWSDLDLLQAYNNWNTDENTRYK